LRPSKNIFLTATFASLLFLLHTFAFSQTDYIDSLRTELNRDVDTAYVDILLDISFWHRNSSPDSTIFYAEKALMISKEIKYKDGEVLSTRNIGMGFEKKGKNDTALYICEKAIVLAEQYNLPGRVGDACNTIGLIHYKKGELEKAAQFFEKAGRLFKEADRSSDAAGSLSNTGIILETKGDYTRALDFYQQALLVFEELEHMDGIANVSHNIANIFKNGQEYKKALEYYMRAAKIDSITNNKSGFATTLANIADVKLTMGDTVGSIANHHKALAIYDQADRKCLKSLTYGDLGNIYLSMSLLDSAYYYVNQSYKLAIECENDEQQVAAGIDFGKYYRAVGQQESAKKYLHESFDLADVEDMKPLQSSAAELLYLIYKEQNNLRQALKFLEAQKRLEDAIFNAENTREIAQLEAQYTLEKEKQQFEYEKQLKQMEYEKQLAHEKLIQRIFLIAILVFTALTIIILRLYFQKSKMNKNLDFSNKEITQQNAQILEQHEEILQQRDLLEERSKVVEQQKRNLEKVNEELVELNEEKNTIIGIVAHDLKSPINQIIGLVELSKMEKDNLSETLRTYLEQMEISSKRSVNMINRMLDINTIENKKIEIHSEDINLSKLLRELKSTFDTQASSKGISIEVDLKTDATLHTDKLLISEVFENLISNAMKFSPIKSEIKLGAEKDNGHLKLFVSDDGPGISESDQKLMWNKYQKVSAAPTANEKSTGLGLAIVKRYCDALGFEVYCESDVKKGTTFYISVNQQHYK